MCRFWLLAISLPSKEVGPRWINTCSGCQVSILPTRRLGRGKHMGKGGDHREPAQRLQ